MALWVETRESQAPAEAFAVTGGIGALATDIGGKGALPRPGVGAHSAVLLGQDAVRLLAHQPLADGGTEKAEGPLLREGPVLEEQDRY